MFKSYLPVSSMMDDKVIMIDILMRISELDGMVAIGEKPANNQGH
jgi:hypothetical protein